MNRSKIIATDFDGTLCESKWPEIGAPNWEAIDYLKEQKAYQKNIIRLEYEVCYLRREKNHLAFMYNCTGKFNPLCWGCPYFQASKIRS